MGEGEGHALQVFFQQASHADLVFGVHGGPQERDGHRFHFFFFEFLDDPDDARLIERLVDAPVSADSLWYLVSERARDVGLGKRHQEVERLHAPALAQHEDIGVALRGEEGGLRGVSRHDGVGGVRGAVDEELALGEEFFGGRRERNGCCLYRRENALHRVLGRRGGLEHVEAAPLVLQHQVGEGPARIDRESHSSPPALIRALTPADEVELSLSAYG